MNIVSFMYSISIKDLFNVYFQWKVYDCYYCAKASMRAHTHTQRKITQKASGAILIMAFYAKVASAPLYLS